MDFDTLITLPFRAEQLAVPGVAPSVLDSLLQTATDRTVPVCTMVYTHELGQQLGEFVKESVCLAIAIPPDTHLDWTAQTADWLIPYCEVNHLERTTLALVILGDGLVAISTAALAPMLFGVEKVFVVFVAQQGTLAVAYRWNEKCLASVTAADVAAKRYEFDEYGSARAVAIGKPIFGCSDGPALVPMPVALKADGTVEPDIRRELQLRPFSPYNPEYAA